RITVVRRPPSAPGTTSRTRHVPVFPGSNAPVSRASPGTGSPGCRSGWGTRPSRGCGTGPGPGSPGAPPPAGPPAPVPAPYESIRIPYASVRGPSESPPTPPAREPPAPGPTGRDAAAPLGRPPGPETPGRAESGSWPCAAGGGPSKDGRGQLVPDGG